MQLAPGTDVVAIAVSPDGDTLFAAVYAEPGCEVLTPGNWYVYKSVDGGYTWMATGFVDDGSDIVAIDISPLWEDDEIIVVATTSDCYYSEDRGNNFASMAATGLGNITSMDVGLDENADAAYLIGTSQDVYISSSFSGWIRQNVADGNNSNVLAAAFSPNYITDGTVFAILQQYGSTPTTTLRCETDIETNNWGSYIMDAPLGSGASETAINATRASIAFADGFSSVPSVFVGLVAYNGSAQDGDAYRVDLGTVASTVTDLDIRGEDTQTNVNSIAVSGNASSALILTGMHDLTSSGPMSNWVGQVHYSANGGDTWLRSYKPPSGLSATVCAPAIVMSPDFGESGIAYCGNGFINSSSATEFSGFYVSTTQGTTWNGRGLLDFDIDEIEDIVPSPDYDSDSTLFMVTRDAYVPDNTYPLTNFGLLWETEDHGNHWELILSMTTMIPLPGVSIDKIEIPAIYPDEPAIFVTGGRNCMDSGDTARIDRSTDEGNIFATTFLGPYDTGIPLPVQAWAVIDKDTLIVSNANRIWKTADTGAHWNETDTSEIAPTETVVDMQLFNDTAVLVGTDCGNAYLCHDWESDFSFTQVGSITLGADNSVYVAFDADFNSNGYLYAGVTDIGDNEDQEGIWRVGASTNASWDRLYDAGEDVYSIAYEGSGRLWALTDGSAVVSLNPTAADPDDVVFTIVNTSLTSYLTGGLETVINRLFTIGGTNSTQLWTYAVVSGIWVDDNFNASTPGWGVNHFNKIQDGIDAASASIAVEVASGVYYENIVLKDGVELLGADMNSTIIDGMQNGSVVTAINCGNTTKLEGFTVTNGSAFDGGGMYNYNASPTITNCIFQNNTVTGGGGGMYNEGASPLVTNCTFLDNRANDGSGMYNRESSPVITNCTFEGNFALGLNPTGGGMKNFRSSPIITNCIFLYNFAGEGGGIACGDSSPVITNCVFFENAGPYGYAVYSYDSSPIITNCIMWDNYNNEIYINVYPNPSETPVVTYCDIQGGYSGIGNIDSDPLFVNASAGDFHLSTGSPCIDAGSNSAPSLPALDYEGDPRILPVWGTADMGVDEYIHPAPSCDSWDVRYRIVGGQITMNYSAGGITPVKKITPLSEEHGGYMTFKFCKEADNGSRLVVIPQDSWYMETILVENVMTGIDMNLSIRLDSDASGILYVNDNIGDVDVSSESVSGRAPVQIDTIGNGATDAAGSMLIPMTLVGDFNTSVGQSGELPFGMIFTTENTTNVASIPENPKMDGATMTSDGVPFAEDGGPTPYVGTNGTITATGTGDCLGIRLVGIRIDFQFEMKLELEPMIPDGFYGDADQDGALSIGDYSLLRLMLFGKQPFNPGGDADQDGELSIGDYSYLRLMLFGKQANANRYESSYDFSSGWSSNRRAGSNSMSSLPLTLFDNFNTDPDGWIAGDAADYINISNTDGNVWTIAGSEGNYSMLQCMFSPDVSPNNITSIGVMLNGSAQTNSDVLQLWVWNCDTGSWRQIGNDFSMTTDIEPYTAWTAWGKVYADYIDGDGYMYILANLNNVNQALNVDYIKLSAIW